MTKGLTQRMVPRLEKLGLLVVAGLGVYVTASYGWVALQALGYPYHLEWMEGGSVETAARLLAGESIYPEPSIDYVGYIYTPLYYVFAAASSLLFGETLFACRLVSVLATVGTCALSFLTLRHEGVAVKWAFFAPVLWLATYELSGRWLFLARVDSLFIFFLVASLYGLRFWKSRRLAVATAVLMWLAYLTKQSAAMALFPAGLAVLWLDRRRGFLVGGLFTALAVSSTVALDLATEGWFGYYAFEVAARHEIMGEFFVDFWRHDLFRVAPLVGLSLIALALMVGRGDDSATFYGAAMVGALATSWSSRLHSGGVDNVLMPSYLMCCLLAPFGLALVEHRLGRAERRRLGTSPSVLAVLAVIVYQLGVGTYPVDRMLPSEAQYAAGERLMTYLAEVDGEVLMPDYRWLQREAGQPSFGLGMAAKDILRQQSDADPGRDALIASLEAAFAEQRFVEIILSDGAFMRRELSRYYCYERPMATGPEPVTGWLLSPSWVWVPRRPDTIMLSGERSHECPAGRQRRRR